MKMKVRKLIISGLTALLLTGSVGISPMVTMAADFSKFADGGMAKTHWAYNDVNYALDNGWLNGKKDGNSVNLDVNGIITRAEYLKMALDILDPGFTKFKSNPERVEMYNEINTSHLPDWYEDYVRVYNSMGNKFGDNTSQDWNTPISREEMAILIQGLVVGLNTGSLQPKLNNIENNIKDKYSKKYDGKRIGWNAVEIMYSNGIMTGDDKGNFNPLNNATRGEACAVLRRLADPSARLTVVVEQDKAEDRYDYVEGENATLRQDDPYRRSVKEGDKFIDLNGKEWTVKLDPVTGMYNPTDPVGFDLGRENSLGEINVVTMDSDGSAGGKFGDILVQAPCGRIAWTGEFEKLYESGFDKPTTPGTKEGQLSPYKYWVWSTVFEPTGEWLENSDFMYEF